MKKALLLLALLLSMFVESSCARREEYKRPKVHAMITMDDFKVAVLRYYEKKDDVIFNYELDTLFKSKNVMCGDATYWQPSLEWLCEEVIPKYKNYLDHMDINYNKHFDCDDYARTFASFAHLKYQNLKKDEPCQGIAVGEIWYRPDPINNPTNSFNHAINVIVLNDNTVCFLEPQGCIRVLLTEFEFNNIILVKF